jgi:PPOX class probable F420-dependent enzyme
MTALNDATRNAITAGRLAHLVTINPDGSPQVSLVWVGIEDDELVIGHLGTGRKFTNIARDPRVVVSIETEGSTEIGLDHYLLVHGTARVTEGGAPELLQRLAHVYLGPDVKFPAFDNPPPGHVIRITVDRIAGVGPWTED